MGVSGPSLLIESTDFMITHLLPFDGINGSSVDDVSIPLKDYTPFLRDCSYSHIPTPNSPDMMPPPHSIPILT